MASLPKLSLLPSIHFLVLVLALGVGLLPKNLMASGRGRATRIEDKDIMCFEHDCGGEEDCTVTPTRPEFLETTCPKGFCFEDIREDNDSKISSSRRCPSYEEVACLIKHARGCLKYTYSGDPAQDVRGDYSTCLDETAKGRSGFGTSGAPGRGVRCVCKKEICNNRTEVGPSPDGGKRIGCNVALVGALLVLPLRKMFLVG